LPASHAVQIPKCILWRAIRIRLAAPRALLRASHIVPWAECSSDAERLDVHNGLLLSSLWDAAFDAGLASFADDGHALAAPGLDPAARVALGFDAAPALTFTEGHSLRLAWHRKRYGF